MRVVKKPEVRKAEIIQAAEKLFTKKGYTNTPIEAIIKEADIAKGTLYYYFESKTEILKSLTNAICADLEKHFHSIINKHDLSAIKKLELMLRGSVKKEKIRLSIMGALHKPENRELQEELNIQTIKLIAPLLFTVIEQGHKEGSFKRAASLEEIQIILAGSQFILDSGLFKWPTKKRDALLKSLQGLLELVTGAKPNALNFIQK
jgi:AcrR family transcriptional regulator